MAIENDIVLVYLDDSPVFFARVESIWPDVKKEWFNIELLILQIPVKSIVWTLKDIYIEGSEFFMGGNRMRIEVVRAPETGFEMDQDQKRPPLSASRTNPFLKQNPFKNKSETQLKPNNGEKGVQKEPSQKKEGSGAVISLADFQKKKKDNQ